MVVDRTVAVDGAAFGVGAQMRIVQERAPRGRAAAVLLLSEPSVDVAFAHGRGRSLWVGAGLVTRPVRLDGTDAGE